MSKILISAIACGAIFTATSVAQAQTTDSGTAPTTGATSPTTKHTTKKRRAMAKPLGNEAGVATPNSTGSTSAPFTGSGNAVSTTPDQMQIKNARDGSPMKSSKGSMGMASGASK